MRPSEISIALGYSRSAAHHWIAGRSRPSPVTMAKIRKMHAEHPDCENLSALVSLAGEDSTSPPRRASLSIESAINRRRNEKMPMLQICVLAGRSERTIRAVEDRIENWRAHAAAYVEAVARYAAGERVGASNGQWVPVEHACLEVGAVSNVVNEAGIVNGWEIEKRVENSGEGRKARYRLRRIADTLPLTAPSPPASAAPLWIIIAGSVAVPSSAESAESAVAAVAASHPVPPSGQWVAVNVASGTAVAYHAETRTVYVRS